MIITLVAITAVAIPSGVIDTVAIVNAVIDNAAIATIDKSCHCHS